MSPLINMEMFRSWLAISFLDITAQGVSNGESIWQLRARSAGTLSSSQTMKPNTALCCWQCNLPQRKSQCRQVVYIGDMLVLSNIQDPIEIRHNIYTKQKLPHTCAVHHRSFHLLSGDCSKQKKTLFGRNTVQKILFCCCTHNLPY